VILTLNCDGADDAPVTITDDGTGGRNNVAVAGLAPFEAAISQIQVFSGGGLDTVSYSLLGDLRGTSALTPNLPRQLNVDLGPGDDQFFAFFNGRDLETGSSWHAVVFGKDGADKIQVYANQSGGSDVRDGAGTLASLTWSLNGSGGKDKLFSAYFGEQDGRFQFTQHGNSNQDRNEASVSLAGGSNGVDNDSRLALGYSGVPSLVRGGDGDDTVLFNVFLSAGDGDPTIFAKLHGDAGVDKCKRTGNVPRLGCEM
jgi:hypothetical protein